MAYKNKKKNKAHKPKMIKQNHSHVRTDGLIFMSLIIVFLLCSCEKDLNWAVTTDFFLIEKGNIKPCKVGVFGSRTLKDERVKTIIIEKIIELKATKIITSHEPQGVCEVAQRVAKQYGYPLEVHFLNEQYLRGMFEQRSKEVIAEVDYLIFIHDGKSKGTENELNLYKKTGKPYHYEILEQTQYDRSVGFNIKDDWDFKVDLPVWDADFNAL